MHHCNHIDVISGRLHASAATDLCLCEYVGVPPHQEAVEHEQDMNSMGNHLFSQNAHGADAARQALADKVCKQGMAWHGKP